MSHADVIQVKPEIAAHALLNRAQYELMAARAQAEPDAFWAEQAKRLTWIKAPTKIKNTDFHGDVSIKWFEDGTLNASVNCLDRHLAERGDQVAIIWEGDDPAMSTKVTYRELHEKVCRLANALTAQGIKKGDVVTIYLPMVVEAAVALLAAAAQTSSYHTSRPGCMATSPPVMRATITLFTLGQVFSASSALAFSATLRPPRRPSSAVIRATELQSCRRLARLSGEKPPNTTE